MHDLRRVRITRRAFSAGLVGGAAALLAPGPLIRAVRAQAEAELGVAAIAPGASVVTGGGGNALVVVGDGGSLLVDCKNYGLGGALREAAEGLGVPLAAVVNTHHHGDHTGGNPAFTEDLPVYAHRACSARVRDQVVGRGDDPAPFLPTIHAGPDTTLDVAGVKCALRHAGAGHTDNDLFVYLPDANILHTGDLIFNELHPYIDRPAGATTSGWIASCEAMLRVCDKKTVVVPGHGDVGDRTMIERQIAYFHAVREAIGAIVDAGGSREEAGKTRLTLFEGMGFERLRRHGMESVYDEISEGRGG